MGKDRERARVYLYLKNIVSVRFVFFVLFLSLSWKLYFIKSEEEKSGVSFVYVEHAVSLERTICSL